MNKARIQIITFLQLMRFSLQFKLQMFMHRKYSKNLNCANIPPSLGLEMQNLLVKCSEGMGGAHSTRVGGEGGGAGALGGEEFFPFTIHVYIHMYIKKISFLIS